MQKTLKIHVLSIWTAKTKSKWYHLFLYYSVENGIQTPANLAHIYIDMHALFLFLRNDYIINYICTLSIKLE